MDLTLTIGETKQVKATASLKSGGTRVVTGQCTWSSEDQSVAITDEVGSITGIGNGSAIVTVTINGIQAYVNVTVT